MADNLKFDLEAEKLLGSLRRISDDTRQVAIDANKMGAEFTDAFQKASRTTDNYEDELKGVKKAVKQIENETSSYSDELKLLEQLQKNVTDKLKKYIKEGKGLKQLEAQISQVKDRIKEVRDEQEKLNNTDNGGFLEAFEADGINGLISKLSEGGGALGRFGKFASLAKASVIGLVAVKVIQVIAGWTKALFDLASEADNARKKVSQLTNLAGSELTEATAKVEALAVAYQDVTDFDEILQAANAVSKNLKIEFSDALDTIEKGLERGANANGEYLDSLKEYTPFAKEAGISLDQLNQILIKSTKDGVFSDKGIDAVKESTLRLREFTQTTQDALTNAFGADFTQQIKIKVNSGDVFGAIQDVSARLPELEGKADKLGAVLADVFGGAGEDAGTEFLESLKDINGELETLTIEQERQVKVQRELVEAEEASSRFLLSATNFSAAVLSIPVICALSALIDACIAAALFLNSSSEISPVSAKVLSSSNCELAALIWAWTIAFCPSVVTFPSSS